MEPQKLAEDKNLASRKVNRFMTWVGVVIGIVILFIASQGIYDTLFGWDTATSSDDYSESGEYTDSGYAMTDECNIYGITMHGGLLTYMPSTLPEEVDSDIVSSDAIVEYIRAGEEDDRVQAMLVDVESGGGSPVAGEEIANAIKSATKPVVAVIRGSGASAAYWAISSADKIYASKNSDVGSIGVTSSYLQKIDKDSTYIELSSGKFKNMGDSDKIITPEEKELYMRDIMKIYDNFVQAIAENRHLPIDEVKRIGDGSTVLGDTALELGLIDQIGSWTDAETYLGELIKEEPEICWQ